MQRAKGIIENRPAYALCLQALCVVQPSTFAKATVDRRSFSGGWSGLLHGRPKGLHYVLMKSARLTGPGDMAVAAGSAEYTAPCRPARWR